MGAKAESKLDEGRDIRTLSPSDLQKIKDELRGHPFLSCFGGSYLSFCQLEMFGLYELVNVCAREKPTIKCMRFYFLAYLETE
jgi:hypothetical protein